MKKENRNFAIIISIIIGIAIIILAVILIQENKSKNQNCSEVEAGEEEDETSNIECSIDDDCVELYDENYVCSKALVTFGQCIETKINKP